MTIKYASQPEKMYGVPRVKIMWWWNGLVFSTKLRHRDDLLRLGMSNRDAHSRYTKYAFSSLTLKTQRAIARLYKEYGGGS